MKNTRRSFRWIQLARIGIVGIMLILLLPAMAQPQFFNTFANVRLPVAAIAFLFSLASVAAKAQRWGLVLRARGIEVRYRYLLASYFVGLFFNNYLPSGLGGDAVRAYDSARKTGRGKEAITAVILERGSGMLVVFGGGSLLALFQPNLPLPIALLAHGLFLGVLTLLILLWQDFTGRLLDWLGEHLIAELFGGRLKGLWNKLIEVYAEFRGYRHQTRLLIMLLLQAILTQALAAISLYTLILALNYNPPFGAFIAVTGIATSLDLVPISLNSFGVREGAYAYFLGLLAIPPSVGVAFAFSIRILALSQALIGGLLLLARNVRPALHAHPDADEAIGSQEHA